MFLKLLILNLKGTRGLCSQEPNIESYMRLCVRACELVSIAFRQHFCKMRNNSSQTFCQVDGSMGSLFFFKIYFSHFMASQRVSVLFAFCFFFLTHSLVFSLFYKRQSFRLLFWPWRAYIGYSFNCYSPSLNFINWLLDYFAQ